MKHKTEKQTLNYLRGEVRTIVHSSAKFLNTSEINIIEYLKNDLLIKELILQKKNLPECALPEIDIMIAWLDEEWFSYKLSERMTVLFSFKLF